MGDILLGVCPLILHTLKSNGFEIKVKGVNLPKLDDYKDLPLYDEKTELKIERKDELDTDRISKSSQTVTQPPVCSQRINLNRDRESCQREVVESAKGPPVTQAHSVSLIVADSIKGPLATQANSVSLIVADSIKGPPATQAPSTSPEAPKPLEPAEKTIDNTGHIIVPFYQSECRPEESLKKRRKINRTVRSDEVTTTTHRSERRRQGHRRNSRVVALLERSASQPDDKNSKPVGLFQIDHEKQNTTSRSRREFNVPQAQVGPKFPFLFNPEDPLLPVKLPYGSGYKGDRVSAQDYAAEEANFGYGGSYGQVPWGTIRHDERDPEDPNSSSNSGSGGGGGRGGRGGDDDGESLSQPSRSAQPSPHLSGEQTSSQPTASHQVQKSTPTAAWRSSSAYSWICCKCLDAGMTGMLENCPNCGELRCHSCTPEWITTLEDKLSRRKERRKISSDRDTS